MFLLTDPCLRADALSLGECTRLIGTFDASPDIKAGRLSGGSETDTRICDTLWMDDTPETAWIFTRLAELVADVNRENFQFDLEEFRESAQILKYSAPVSASDGASDGATLAGRYDTHVDIGGGGHSATRKLSLSIQLSAPDSYTGGGLQIGNSEDAWSAPREPGTAILFPSFVRHSVAPLVSGVRYALVAWVHGPAFR
jgi:PKHD-type hydroxylase